jgi:hypothetical protein
VFDRPVGAQARPRPILGTINQAGAQRVTLDVAQHRKQVLVLLDGERLESPQPDVAAGSVVLQLATHMRRHQPMHPPAELAVVAGSDDQVEVVGHEAIAEQSHGHPTLRGDDWLKRVNQPPVGRRPSATATVGGTRRALRQRPLDPPHRREARPAIHHPPPRSAKEGALKALRPLFCLTRGDLMRGLARMLDLPPAGFVVTLGVEAVPQTFAQPLDGRAAPA